MYAATSSGAVTSALALCCSRLAGERVKLAMLDGPVDDDSEPIEGFRIMLGRGSTLLEFLVDGGMVDWCGPLGPQATTGESEVC